MARGNQLTNAGVVARTPEPSGVSEMKASDAPKVMIRVSIAIVVGALAALYVFERARLTPSFGSDFDQVWFAARDIRYHHNPYMDIGPGRQGNWPWPFYYPATAAVLAIPLSWLPVVAARCVFIGLSTALLAFALSARGLLGLIPLASGAFLSAVQMCQWSPLLAAGMLLPAISWVWTAKPNLGVAQLAARPNRLALAAGLLGGLVLLLAAFAYLPSWFGDWVAATHTAPHIRPLALSWLGSPLLLAALRWRRPEGRVLLALAIVPTNPGIHDALLLLATPLPFAHAALLSASTLFVDSVVGDWPSDPSFAAYAAANSRALLALVYLPALAMAFLRPNEGPAPLWLDRALRRAPTWLRGQPSPA
jgi:hypothetical protein